MNDNLSKNIKKKLRVINNFPKKGVKFQDITSITDNPKLFSETVKEIALYAKKNCITKIAGIEARGFIFGSAVAVKNNIAFVPIRKKNKLPGKVFKKKYKLEYGFDEIQVHKNAINKKDKVLIVDDLIATGGTALATADLINKFAPQNISCFFIINLSNLGGFKKIQKRFNAEAIIQAEG